MSVIDPLKNLFSRKPPAPPVDASLSLAMPDQGSDTETPETVQVLHAPAVPLPDRHTAEARADSDTAAADQGLVRLPFLGLRAVAQHRRLLGASLGLSLLLVAGVTVLVLRQSHLAAQHIGGAGQALLQSQRLLQATSQALVGNAAAFADLAESAGMLVQSTRSLREGDTGLGAALDALSPLVERSDKAAAAVLQQQKLLTQIGSALVQIPRQCNGMLESTQRLSELKLQQGAPAVEVAAVGQLGMLTQRIGKSANEFLTAPGVSAVAVALLAKDLASLRELALGLLDGNAELHLAAAKDAASREQLQALLKQAEDTQQLANAILGNTQALAAAHAAQATVQADSPALRQGLEALQARLSDEAGGGAGALTVLVLAALAALLSAAGLFYLQRQDSRRRQAGADSQRLEAERQEQEAKRVNDANQAAILRLMNELQTVAEGDLTQEATVTEDITGAIADSVNYTVEELRSLVGNVQKTAAQVAQTTADVDATSTELLAASKEQLHEIRETGQGVLEMAGRINDVSAQAQESARVARQSLLAAESGLTAVQNAIGGMNAIRDQIQETSKRIKRLGESSQEIGEITELISDITEQTNVLALNAAIQAASAGDAGRGFSVVAEEVQRLAERSADATRQIAALVKAIQTDTQDAIGAMERSTQGVVEGAKLSDNAGTALTEIDRVSRRVADLIEQISDAASREAGLATGTLYVYFKSK
ncbi:MAG: type IV pili methyl-accepting chemotaxis transducer N-terminal domain-containing protein, partial [Rhodoferax sp.]|nr:type IV pili methyl-accepting chemotaxis transducer N-terminal domain-containing protein [Rhodoferax sp.]